MFTSFRQRLLFCFSLILASSFVIVVLTHYHQLAREKISKSTALIESAYVLMLKDINIKSDLFNQDVHRPEFFKTRTSANLRDHQRTEDSIQWTLDAAIASFKHLPYTLDSGLYQVERQLKKSEAVFDTLTALLLDRGYKDYNLEGAMRRHIHWLEDHRAIPADRMLSLRRHEKDFLMRMDRIYAERLHEEMDSWKVSGNVPPDLVSYVAYFDTLTNYYMLMFRSGKEGLYYNWTHSIEALQEGVRKQRSLLLRTSFEESAKAQTFNYILISIAILLAVGCTILFTRRFSKQVNELQQTMAQYIATNYQLADETSLRVPRNDFGKITLHFFQLTRKIRADMQLLEDRVQRRTKSLQLKNHQLELQHREIMGSLRYAQDLQQSLLVSRSKMLRSFREAWVYYQPKNLVGGDFYWMKEVKQPDEHLVFFALADCTGHGVPGALLSVMGMNALDELIDSGLRQPSLILNELRSLVSRRLNTHEDKRYDGMDLALFVLDRRTNTLTFSGAQMPLWILRDSRLIETQGQRMPIGYTYFEVNSFENYEIALETNDKLILFSDGVIDQFGGLHNKKLGRKALREWLITNSKDGSAALFSKLVQQFEFWKGNGEQTDDCTLLLLEPGVCTEVKQANDVCEEIVVVEAAERDTAC